MKTSYKFNKICTLLLLLYFSQFVTGCSGLKSMSMINSSHTLLAPDVKFQKQVPVKMNAHMMQVDVFINDEHKPYKFLVDTGAITVITENAAKGLNFTDTIYITLNDIAGNAEKTRMVTVKKLGISGLKIGNLAVIVTNLDKLGPGIDGILGSNYFQHFTVTIDYRTPSLILSDTHPKPSTRTTTIPFKKNMKFGFAPTAECQVDHISIPCMVDTGDPKAISIPSSNISKLPGFKNNKYVQSNGSLTHGIFNGSNGNDFVINVENFKAGPLQLHGLAASSNNFDQTMTIGKTFLENYTVSIDYQDNKLYLTPFSDITPNLPIFTYGFGMSRDDQGTIRVNGIWEDSPGAKAGLEIGDEICSINGIAPENLSMLQLVNNLQTQKIITVELKKQTGGRQLIKLIPEDLSKRVNN